ncbi:hypothetical protein PIB30_012915 [Stylosanthes scabra]|uniref:Uncharacterized protein n=1 Tax=Stylosanthes scabra TaxID=79078 RepID=A0ABU6X6C4_9FABA|nr:hypothetical protein [Stylosanthes scabra]
MTTETSTRQKHGRPVGPVVLMKLVSTAEFGAEVAGESERNERITTKPRRSLLDQMCTH